MTAAAFTLAGRRVFVAGHRGMVGAALVRRLAREDCEVLTAPRSEVDLTRQDAVEGWFGRERPEVVFLAAARVGGIHANDAYPADFLYDNLAIETSVIHAAHRSSVRKLVFLGSSCIYPRLAEQPMREDCLLGGALEPTNRWYAIAKIAGLMLCQAYRRQHGDDFVSVMPTNLYGPGDNFHPENAHVPAALMRRFHLARLAGEREVVVWGTGTPRREFLHVDDLADACVFVASRYSGEMPLNVGSGAELSIAEFAECMREVVGYQGTIAFDASRPDGAPRKLLDTSRLDALGWRAGTGLEDGLRRTYRWFVEAGIA